MFRPFKLTDKTNNSNSSTNVGSLRLNSTLSRAARTWRGLTFSRSSSQFLNRTPNIAGDSQKFTWSGWLKRCDVSTASTFFNVFGANRGSGTTDGIYFDNNGNNNAIYIYVSSTGALITENLFRDTSAWYHIILAVDTTQAISEDRVKLYVNGIRIKTFIAGSIYPAQNSTSAINTVAEHRIGNHVSTSYPFDGIMSEITFVDGQQLDQFNFGYFDNLNIWQPRRYGGSFGTNGFYLTFTNTSSLIDLCRDQSGNDNHWTPQNYGSSLPPLFYAVQDSPVNNYCVLNSLSTTAGTYSFGGLRYLGASAWRRSNSTFSLNSGKWYYEVTIANAPFVTRSSTTSYNAFGFGLETTHDSTTAPNSATDVLIYSDNGFFKNFSGAVTDAGYAIVTNDVLAVAVDLDANTFTFYRNNFAVASGTIGVTAGTYLTPICYSYNNAYGVMDFNFGQEPFAFTPPAGYKPICSNNMNVPTITDGKRYFDIATYDGGNSVYASDIYADYLKLAMPLSPYQTSANIAMSLSNNAARVKVSTSANITYPTTSPANQKFYSGAALFNNLGTSRITIPNDADFQFGTGDFTIEGWVNSVALKANGIFAKCSVDATWASGWTCEINSGYITFYNGAARYAGATNLMAINTWYHVAWTRENGTLRQFVNGNLVRTDTGITTSLSPTSNFSLGNDFTTNTYSLNAYIQDFRIYKGFAKYTAAFTPPTAMVTSEGSGGTKTISNFNFSPDLAWFKLRQSGSHGLYDTVRGANNVLSSDTTGAEQTAFIDELTSFDANGFTLGASTNTFTNAKDRNYTVWAWDAGLSSSTNTSGSVTSTVRANALAGFSIVSFTTPVSNQSYTVGHGLGISPKMTIVKRRDGVNGWWVWHTSLGDNTTDYLELHTTAAEQTGALMWGTVGRNNSVCGLNSPASTVLNALTILYCFAEIEGFSKFGSYTGNGSTNGTFVYCGFRPKWVMIKYSSTSGTNWNIFDSQRSPFNIIKDYISANTNNAENTSGALNIIDFTSNGFKIRSSDTYINASTGTYIFAAFAENPFRYARAR